MSKARDIANIGSNDVLGTDAVGLTVSGDLTVADSYPDFKIQDTDGSDQFILMQQVGGASMFKFQSGTNDGELYFTGGRTGVNKMKIATNGDIIMYKDDGTTAGMTFDASAGSIDVTGAVSSGGLNLSTDDGFAYLSNVGTGNAGIYVRGMGASNTLRSHSTGIHTWELTGSEKMRIDGSGVKIGPNAQDIQLLPASSNSGLNKVYLRGNATDEKSTITLNHYGVRAFDISAGVIGSGLFHIGNGASDPAFVIDGSSKVGIGTTSITHALTVKGSGVIGKFYSDDQATELKIESPTVDVIGLYTGTNDALALGTAGTERMRVSSGGALTIGNPTARGKVTINVDSASADGLYMDNANGSASLDLVVLGSGYNAHGANAGEVWLYSPDNINIGGSNADTNDIKFLGGGIQRMRISATKPLINTHGVLEFYYHGSLPNSTTVVNIDISNQVSAGVVLIEAGYSHHAIGSYGATRISTLGVYAGTIVSTNDIQNITSGNGGSWSYSVPVTGTIRITKNAGTYVGGGYYWVKVTAFQG